MVPTWAAHTNSVAARTLTHRHTDTQSYSAADTSTCGARAVERRHGYRRWRLCVRCLLATMPRCVGSHRRCGRVPEPAVAGCAGSRRRIRRHNGGDIHRRVRWRPRPLQQPQSQLPPSLPLRQNGNLGVNQRHARDGERPRVAGAWQLRDCRSRRCVCTTAITASSATCSGVCAAGAGAGTGCNGTKQPRRSRHRRRTVYWLRCRVGEGRWREALPLCVSLEPPGARWRVLAGHPRVRVLGEARLCEQQPLDRRPRRRRRQRHAVEQRRGLHRRRRRRQRRVQRRCTWRVQQRVQAQGHGHQAGAVADGAPSSVPRHRLAVPATRLRLRCRSARQVCVDVVLDDGARARWSWRRRRRLLLQRRLVVGATTAVACKAASAGLAAAGRRRQQRSSSLVAARQTLSLPRSRCRVPSLGSCHGCSSGSSGSCSRGGLLLRSLRLLLGSVAAVPVCE